MLLSIIIIIIIISMRKQWEEQQVPSVMRRMSQAGSMHPMCRGWLSSSPNNSTAATTGITEWLKKYPNSTAVTTDITGWLKKYPNNTAATTGITEWLKKYPNSTAATTDIVINITGWLKKYPKRQNEFLDNHMKFLWINFLICRKQSCYNFEFFKQIILVFSKVIAIYNQCATPLKDEARLQNRFCSLAQVQHCILSCWVFFWATWYITKFLVSSLQINRTNISWFVILSIAKLPLTS